MPTMRVSLPSNEATFESIFEHFRADTLVRRLGEVQLRSVFVLGADSPLLPRHNIATAALMPSATYQIENARPPRVDGASWPSSPRSRWHSDARTAVGSLIIGQTLALQVRPRSRTSETTGRTRPCRLRCSKRGGGTFRFRATRFPEGSGQAALSTGNEDRALREGESPRARPRAPATMSRVARCQSQERPGRGRTASTGQGSPPTTSPAGRPVAGCRDWAHTLRSSHGAVGRR